MKEQHAAPLCPLCRRPLQQGECPECGDVRGAEAPPPLAAPLPEPSQLLSILPGLLLLHLIVGGLARLAPDLAYLVAGAAVGEQTVLAAWLILATPANLRRWIAAPLAGWLFWGATAFASSGEFAGGPSRDFWMAVLLYPSLWLSLAAAAGLYRLAARRRLVAGPPAGRGSQFSSGWLFLITAWFAIAAATARVAQDVIPEVRNILLFLANSAPLASLGGLVLLLTAITPSLREPSWRKVLLTQSVVQGIVLGLLYPWWLKANAGGLIYFAAALVGIGGARLLRRFGYRLVRCGDP